MRIHFDMFCHSLRLHSRGRDGRIGFCPIQLRKAVGIHTIVGDIASSKLRAKRQNNVRKSREIVSLRIQVRFVKSLSPRED